MPILNYLAQEKNIQHTIRIVCFINCCLYKEWVFTKNSLHMVLLFLINCICCHHGHFPSLYVFSAIKFQNFSVGVLSRAFVLWCLVCFSNMKFCLFLLIFFCGELQYIFLLLIYLSLSKRLFFIFGFQSNRVFVRISTLRR